MKIVALATLKAELDRGQRLLGLDLGAKTIGLALSDPDLCIASPLKTLRRQKFSLDAQQLALVCTQNHVGGLVVGLPLNMDGSEGRRCQSTRHFVKNLSQFAPSSPPSSPNITLNHLNVTFWDERLSTRAMERVLIDAADMRRNKRKNVIDKMAASSILQEALDALMQS